MQPDTIHSETVDFQLLSQSKSLRYEEERRWEDDGRGWIWVILIFFLIFNCVWVFLLRFLCVFVENGVCNWNHYARSFVMFVGWDGECKRDSEWMVLFFVLKFFWLKLMIYDPCKWNGPMHCHQKRALTVSNDQTQQQKKEEEQEQYFSNSDIQKYKQSNHWVPRIRDQSTTTVNAVIQLVFNW